MFAELRNISPQLSQARGCRMDVEVEDGRDTAEVEDTAETTSMLLSPTAQPRPRTVTCIRQAQTALLFISSYQWRDLE